MLYNLLYAVAGSIIAAVGFALGGYAVVAGPVLAAKTVLATVSVWTVLTAIAPILAPLLALALTFLGRVIWNHEKRLRSLERDKTRQSRTLYGDEDDPQQPGLSQDLNEMSSRIDTIEGKVDDLYDEIKKLAD